LSYLYALLNYPRLKLHCLLAAAVANDKLSGNVGSNLGVLQLCESNWREEWISLEICVSRV